MTFLVILYFAVGITIAAIHGAFVDSNDLPTVLLIPLMWPLYVIFVAVIALKDLTDVD